MSSLLHSGSSNDREYLIQIKTEYKILEKKYMRAQEELKKWESRINLAKQNGKGTLQREAESRVEIFQKDLNYLTNQLIGLKTELEKAARINSELPQQLSIDPNRLLANLNNLIGNGNSMDLEKKINDLRADNELENLKAKMDK